MISTLRLLHLIAITATAAIAADFKPGGPATPDMLAAMKQLHEAGRLEGRRDSLSFFRWSSAKPPHLAHIGLWGAKISNELFALASTMPELEFVSLYETQVDDSGLAVLSKLPRLRQLSIVPAERYEKAGFGPPQWSYPFLPKLENRPRITGKALRVLAELPTLESIDMRDVGIAAPDLALLVKLPKLAHIGLSCRIEEETITHLQACRRLSKCTLGHRSVTADELGRLSAWKALRQLTLIHATLDADALQSFSRLENLQSLELHSCSLRDDDLQHLRLPPKLTTLILARNEIDGPGLVHLARQPVTELDLNFNNLSDATLKHLPQLKNVEKLNLSYCTGITDAGIRAGALHAMPALLEVNLRGNKAVTDACIDDLVKLARIKRLGIRQNGITEAGHERLKAALPQTTVFR